MKNIERKEGNKIIKKLTNGEYTMLLVSGTSFSDEVLNDQKEDWHYFATARANLILDYLNNKYQKVKILYKEENY